MVMAFVPPAQMDSTVLAKHPYVSSVPRVTVVRLHLTGRNCARKGFMLGMGMGYAHRATQVHIV